MDEELLRILTVSGNGVEKIPTTSAQIRLGMEARGMVATEVQQEIASKSSAVVDLLRLPKGRASRSQNVEQLKTLGIQLRTYHDHTNDLIKYVGSNTITFSVPIDDAGIAIDETIKAGADRIEGITFNATTEAISAAKQEALRKATIDAKTKAEAVLSTLDLKLKEIINIEIDYARLQALKPASHRRRRRSSSTPSGDDERFEMPVVGGEIAVNASVSLQISYFIN